MSRTQQTVGLVIVLAFALGIGYAGWRMRSISQVEACEACGRAIHTNMRTVAFVGQKREVFCCPTCALSAGAQTHESVQFEQLADYNTGNELRPGDAFAVEGSDLVPCVRSHQMINRDGQPVPMDFDRCSPSIIAFANQTAAERFASEHGGEVARFLQLVAKPVASPVH
jgi:NosL